MIEVMDLRYLSDFIFSINPIGFMEQLNNNSTLCSNIKTICLVLVVIKRRYKSTIHFLSIKLSCNEMSVPL